MYSIELQHHCHVHLWTSLLLHLRWKSQPHYAAGILVRKRLHVNSLIAILISDSKSAIKCLWIVRHSHMLRIIPLTVLIRSDSDSRWERSLHLGPCESLEKPDTNAYLAYDYDESAAGGDLVLY
nr:hypothetical protein CFP56_52864 [Quercus suber]